MVNSRADTRLDELEKATYDLQQGRLLLDAAVKELNAQFRRTDDQVTEVRTELTAMLQEMRAGFASLKLKDTSNPDDGSTSANQGSKTTTAGGTSASPMPTFDGSDALAWLARAEQYFLISGTASEDRVGVTMVALAGAALPWYQLLRQRVPDLTWARFARELMKRFGGNGVLNVYEAFAAVPSPPRPPTLAKVTAPMLSSSPPTTAKENTLHAIQQPLPIQQMCTPLTVQQPIPPPVLVPPPSPPSPLTPATPPTLAPVTAPLLSTSGPYILQFQSPFLSLLRCLVSAAHQSPPMAVSFPGSLFSLTGAPFSYLVMLRFLHIVGNLLWFDALATTRKHEFEPPPDRVIYFEF
ncbi:CTTNBP2 N-terminal-like protein [Salvia splendens]|uniref:CTTNBP2 N-terminal-like protein n=1 Tax=Salvia splendens TaxID=180675 RepID=UPI001C270003|nr:CTTNBP2 N-terminal-like protein [Salvia splendens]